MLVDQGHGVRQHVLGQRLRCLRRRLLDDLAVPPRREARRPAGQGHADERLPHQLVGLEDEALAG